MPKVKEITVLCENRPGTLAQVAKVLGDAKVNMHLEEERLLPQGSRYMEAKDVERYKRSLLAKRREIEAGAIGTIRSAGGPGERQADVIDQATDAAQADLQVHLHQTDSRLLRAIEEALARIDRRTFGVCESCKRPISEARLNAVPWTRLCRDCKERQQG